MKNVWLIAVIAVFAFQVNAKDNEGISKDESVKSAAPLKLLKQKSTAAQLPESTTSYKDLGEVLVEEWPDLSVSIGLGPGYDFREKEFEKFKNYSNSTAFSLRLGNSLSKHIESQIEYSKNSDFKTEYGDGSSYSQNITFAFTAFTFNLKVGVPIAIKGASFYPYIIGGLGAAKTRYTNRYKEFSSGQLTYEDKVKLFTSDKCSKAGGGIDIKLYKNLYSFLEFNYWTVRWSSGKQRSHRLYYSRMIGGLRLNF